MSVENDRESQASLVALVTKLLGEKEETRRLVAEFAKGGVSAERVVNEIAARFQLDFGGTVRAVAELDREAAQQLGARMRNRLDSMLAELGEPEAVLRQSKPQRKPTNDFSGRDDDVLRREYVVVKLLLETDNATELKAAALLGAIRVFDRSIDDATLTAHLDRLVKMGVIARERKGRYQSSPASSGHLAALTKELEARGLAVPSVPKVPRVDRA
jgi:DNA-binding transcriptional ArsR family regulator